MRINISVPASLLKGDCSVSILTEPPSIDISVPTDLLKEIKIHAEIGMGIEVPVSLHTEDDWLIIEAPTASLKFRPHAQYGKLALDDLKASGLFYLARSKIIKAVEDSTKNIILHDISINSSNIHVSFSPRTTESKN